MYNPNIPNINEVGHYKKINVTELRQMPEDELIRFFVDMPGGEFVEQMEKMTEEEQKEVNSFIDNIPDEIFDRIEEQSKQKVRNKCLKLIQRLDELDNIIDQEVESTTNFINGVSKYIDNV